MQEHQFLSDITQFQRFIPTISTMHDLNIFAVIHCPTLADFRNSILQLAKPGVEIIFDRKRWRRDSNGYPQQFRSCQTWM